MNITDDLSKQPELCPACVGRGECQLLSLKQTYEEVFIAEMELFEKLQEDPEADAENIKKGLSKAALERTDFIAELRDRGQSVDCPFRKEF